MKIDREKALKDMRSVLAMKPPARGVTLVAAICAAIKACIARYAPPGSQYAKAADSIDGVSGEKGFPVQNLTGILQALISDYENDRFGTFEELVHAAVFDDLLEQARYLMAEGYMLPSAVIAGATLEEHLRQLADRHGIPLAITKNGRSSPKAASLLNDDLLKVHAYSQPEWRQNQVWIDIRNDAAHGKPEFANRTKSEIEKMVDGVREFIMRYPA